MNIPLALSFDDVLLVPQRSEIESRSQVSLKTQIASGFFLDVPIIATNMDTVTGIKMAIAMSQKGGMALIPRFDAPEIEAEKISLIKKDKARVIATVGLRDDFLKRAELCFKAGADGFHLDVAHGHMSKTSEAVIELKRKFKLPVIAGVVATFEGACELFEAGADAVKVGVGAGSICTTRIQTGFGVPQITAISDAARAKKKFKNRFIIADQGMKNSGDIVKALACGASAVVCGNLLSGTEETPGEIIEKDGQFFKEYNGSTSNREKERQTGKFNGHAAHFKLHVEGVESLVKYKGPVADVLDSLCAGIRSGLSYAGARTIPELWKNAKFVQITGAGMRESQAHDVFIQESVAPKASSFASKMIS